MNLISNNMHIIQFHSILCKFEKEDIPYINNLNLL